VDDSKHPPPLRPLARDSEEVQETLQYFAWFAHELEMRALLIADPKLDPLNRAFLIRGMQRVREAIAKASPPFYIEVARAVMLAAKNPEGGLTLVQHLPDGSSIKWTVSRSSIEGDIDPDLFQRAVALWELGPGKSATKKPPDKDVWEI
jgi:hypothetical protein